MTNAFDATLAAHGLGRLRARSVVTLQVNLGKLCNQACRHCHVDAGPHQTSAAVNLGSAVLADVLRVLATGAVKTLDVTGGAPELNPHFRALVEQAHALGVHVIDRCNLTVLFTPGQDDLGAFLAQHRVEIVASLPHYRQDPTDRQRGQGVFDASIAGLQRLNALGYGHGNGLRLNLVANPVGAFLPPSQSELEADTKRELWSRFAVRFDQLYCLTNMPIARFLDWLRRSGNEEAYRQRLLEAFNPHAVPEVMCRDLLSVGPDGTLYDCDFNQMLGLGLDGQAKHIRDFNPAALASRWITTGAHCFGCTAGAGSSCGGATTAAPALAR